MKLFCTTTALKPKYTNLVSPFAPILWLTVLVAFILTWFGVVVIMLVRQALMPKEENQANFCVHALFELFGIVFAEYSYRYIKEKLLVLE